MTNDLPKVGAKLDAKVNLGNYNNIELCLWIEDSVREDLDNGKASAALDRLMRLLNNKLDAWAEEYKDDSGAK